VSQGQARPERHHLDGFGPRAFRPDFSDDWDQAQSVVFDADDDLWAGFSPDSILTEHTASELVRSPSPAPHETISSWVKPLPGGHLNFGRWSLGSISREGSRSIPLASPWRIL
jgi:hypothetical protein